MSKGLDKVECPFCKHIDIDTTFWVINMPFNEYTVRCNKCNKEFICITKSKKIFIYKLK